MFHNPEPAGLVEWHCSRCGDLQRWKVEPAELVCLDCQQRAAMRLNREVALCNVGVPDRVVGTPFDVELAPAGWSELQWGGKPWSLTLYGTAGNGKTTAGTEVFWRYMQRMVDLEAPEIFGEVVADSYVAKRCMWINARMAISGWYSGMEGQMRQVRLLLLDDAFVNTGPKLWEAMSEIVEARYSMEAPTIFTTNLSPEDIYLQDPRIADRLRDGTFLRFEGESMRGRKETLPTPIRDGAL